MQSFYKQYIHPLLHSGQKLVLVPASFSSDLNHKCDRLSCFCRIVIRLKRVTHGGRDCYIKMIKHDATDYAAWANSDDRVSAIIPWHWDGCEGVDDCIKHIDEIGTAELPDVIEHWKGLVTHSQSAQRLRK